MEKSDNKPSLNKVRERLSKMISNMSEAGMRELLKELEKRDLSTSADRREHPRKSVFNYVECLSDDHNFTDLIQDISAGGLFIETQIPFFVGQKLTMTFSFPNAEQPTETTGKVVRVDPKGLGVKFDELISEI